MTAIQTAIANAAKAQVAWEKNTVYKWEKQPTIIKSETYGTCVTFVACTLQRIGVLEPGQFVWTDGTGYGDGKVIGANKRMTVTYYRNKKTIKDIFNTLQPGDILIFNDNKSGKKGSCGHICIFNGKTYKNGINTYTGGHIISVNGKEKYSRKVFAVVRIDSIPKRKTIDELAHEVLDGKWGSGTKRKENLINKGYDYDAVQKRVNELLEPTEKYPGELPTLNLTKTTDEVISDALRFAKWIVGDNRFGYGRMGGSKYINTKEFRITHSGGCHFCGSNAHKISKAKKAGISNPEEWEYTYVCNVFVHACYAHAGVMSMLKARGHAWWTTNYRNSKNWTEIKKPKRASDLKPGDVLGNDGHYVLYVGNGKGAQATSSGDVRSGTKEWSKSISYFDIDHFFKKTKYVFRYSGTVNSKTPIRYGEVSDRVKLLQDYLKWKGADIAADGLFGDATLKAVKDFQKSHGLTVDGIVGSATLKVMGGDK